MILKSILIGLVMLPLLMNTADPPPLAGSGPFVCELQKKDDAFAMEGQGDNLIFCIHSASGIGSAKIIREQGKWPAVVIVRFAKMKMLESFVAKIGKAQISGTLKSAASKGLYFDKDGKPQENAEGSSFSLQIVAMKGDRGIEVRIGFPTGALDVDAIQLAWIDAFR